VSSTPVIPLEQLVFAHYGKALKEENRNSRGSHTVYGSSGVVGNHDQALIQEATIIVGRKGSVGALTYAPDGGWIIDTAYYIECRNPARLDLRYLFHALKSLNLAKDTITTSIPGLNRDDLLANSIPLPPLEQQRRVAAIFDKAGGLRDKRQEVMGLADKFLEANYLKLASEQKERSTVERLLADLPNAARTGPFGSQLLVSEFQEYGIPVLGIDNVVQNQFSWGARRFISEEKYRELERYTVRPGDVMITIMGTTGRVAIAPEDIPTCISTKHLCALTIDKSKMLPEYLWACLRWDPEVKAQTQREAKGAIMEGWNMGIVKGLEVRKAPLAQQKRFAEQVRAIRRIQSHAAQSLDGVHELADSLMAQFFNSKEMPALCHH